MEVPAHVWNYNNEQQVRVNRSDPFLAPYDQGAAYEFVYPAKDPQVLGVGLAATRDVVSFLRHDTSDENPLRGGLDYALAYGQSQSGRFLKGFVYWGFNEDENGRLVFSPIIGEVTRAAGRVIPVEFRLAVMRGIADVAQDGATESSG